MLHEHVFLVSPAYVSVLSIYENCVSTEYTQTVSEQFRDTIWAELRINLSFGTLAHMSFGGVRKLCLDYTVIADSHNYTYYLNTCFGAPTHHSVLTNAPNYTGKCHEDIFSTPVR